MTAGSILPVCIHNNKLLFLFGKENSLDDTPGFSDFGGGSENNESPFKTALREASEELTGFLGNKNDIKKLIKNKYYPLSHNDYHIHIFKLDYDEKLIKYYNNNHKFLWDKMNKKYLKKTCLFEKIEIKWFSINEMKKRKKEFRRFYQEIIDILIKEAPKIKKYIKGGTFKNKKKSNKTLKIK